MSLEDLLEEGEEVEVDGPEVEYEDREYDVYITTERLIFYQRRGFIRKSDDFVSWYLENIQGIGLEKISSGGVVSTGGEALLMEVEDGKIKFECKTETSRLLAKLRARIG